MKCLSLWQPWASAIAVGLKIHETRDWPTSYRGPLAIHAAKRWTSMEREALADFREDPRMKTLPESPPLGAVVAVADLADCKHTVLFKVSDDTDYLLGNYYPGRFAWRLENVRPLGEPLPLRGMQGLFNLPPEIVEEINRRIPA